MYVEIVQGDWPADVRQCLICASLGLRNNQDLHDSWHLQLNDPAAAEALGETI